jgi:hypothetical protein
VQMASNRIDIGQVRNAVNAILDHMVEDLGIISLPIEDADDFYWSLSAPELYDTSNEPKMMEVGSLGEDMDFIRLVHRGASADASYNLVHVAPLLYYIGEKVKR